MIYTIKIYYRTGNSFGSEDSTDEVGMSWAGLDKAKDALRSIKEHYEAYNAEDDNRRPWDQNEKFDLDSIKNKKWFAEQDNFHDYWKYQLMVEKDDGSMQGISPFWCGYFESLYSAEIICEQDTDMKFTI